jgi:hypothetical protein
MKKPDFELEFGLFDPIGKYTYSKYTDCQCILKTKAFESLSVLSLEQRTLKILDSSGSVDLIFLRKGGFSGNLTCNYKIIEADSNQS